MAKITIIGAGSGMFSINLIRDLCLTPNLAGSQISLMDINPARLEAAASLCRRYARAVGIDLTIQATLDRREALQGADFVINTALAAGHDRLQAGWEAAERLGYRMGGSLRIMHDEAFWINHYQYRLMDEIVRDMLEICPRAWFLLVANPVGGGITWLARRYPQARIVGLCHGFGEVYTLAAELGLPRDRLEYAIPGINHFVWLSRLSSAGQDCLPQLRIWAEQQMRAMQAAEPLGRMSRKSLDLYRRFGLYPIGDTASPGGGAWGWWYHTSPEVEQAWGERPRYWMDGYFRLVQELAEKAARIHADPQADLLAEFPPRASGEPMVPLIEALACGTGRLVTVNVPNTHATVPGIPLDFAVECLASCGADGIRPLPMPALPKPILAWALRDYVALIEMELAAHDAHSADLLLAMLLMDPFTRSEEQAQALVEAIFALPGNEDLRAWYRGA